MSLFGTPNKAPFSFGTSSSNNNSTTSNTQTPAAPFSFGTGSNSSNNQAKPLFGGFGAGTPGQNSTGTGTASTGTQQPFSLFGSSNSNNNQSASNAPPAQSNSGFSLFGQGSNTQNQQQQPAATSFGGFGSNSTASNNQSTGFGSSLFGQSNNQQQTQQQQQQPQQNASTLFSSTNRSNPLTVSQLMPSTSSYGSNQFGQSTSYNHQQPGSQQLQPQQPSIEDRIMGIKNSWDPNSPTNRFSYFFYNLSPSPLTVPLTSLPLPSNVASSPHLAQLYKQAVLENPRPDCFLPTLASSMDDLQKRVQAQRQMANLHLSKLKGEEMQGKIQAGNKKHWSDTTVRVERLSREQVKLEERLVRICARLAGLQVSPSSQHTVSGEDADLLLLLERIQAELAGGAGGGGGNGSAIRRVQQHQQQGQQGRGNNTAGGARLAGIVNELWMVVGQRKAIMQGRSGTPDGASSSAEWGVVDEGEMHKVLEVLAQQQKSLDYLSKTLRTLLIDVDTCRLGFGLPPIAQAQQQQQEGKDRPAILA